MNAVLLFKMLFNYSVSACFGPDKSITTETKLDIAFAKCQRATIQNKY